jgi:recombination protein RecR
LRLEIVFMKTPDALIRLSSLLAKLPGVGRRSADRMAMALLRDQGTLLRDLAFSLSDAGTKLKTCSQCGNITPRDEDPCAICTDPRRSGKVLCVVEDPGDIITLERAGGFQGRYHALMGKLSPARGEGVAQIRIDSLLNRVAREQVEEIIIALNADVESDATASFIRDSLAGRNIRISRLARGIPAGAGVAHADSSTLAQALENRRPY